MVVSFGTTAAGHCQISAPHPPIFLLQGLVQGGVVDLIRLTGREKS